MLVLLQVVAVAAVPLKVTVLLPGVAPKFVPVTVTGVPTVPEVGLRVLIVGAEAVTVKLTPLLARPPTVTPPLPVVAPAGTVTAMLVLPQVVAVAAVPLKVTVLLPCVAPKFVPVIVTGVPTVPEVGLRVLIVGAEAVTVKLTPLLARPPTVTTTLPVVAPAGTVTAMLVLPQVVAVAAVPLKVTVLLPCVAPKFVPVIVTGVPTVPEVGLRVLIVGAEAVTVKLTPLLARPPTVTPPLPVVAPAGTVTAMLVLPQVVAVAAVPLKVTVLLPCVAPKFVPVIVTGVPTVPEVGLRVLIVGAEAVTVKLTPLLARPPTVTTTLPVVAPAGTVTAMLVLPQVVAVAAVPLKVTVLLPCVAPKFVPVIVTGVPTVPEVGLRVLIVGAEAVTVKLTPLLARPPTVTPPLPVVAPAGTVTAMLVLPQVVAVAAVPLKVTVLLPCVAPKFVPVIVTGVPTVPEVGLRVLIVGAEAVTVKLTPLLARPPTVTTTLPVVAPAGTVTAMLVLPQVVAVAAVPLKVTVLLPCVAPKFVPVIVTGVPTVPEVGLRVLIVGAEAVTVKLTPLLARPPTVTPPLPVVAPAGTVTAMLVLPQVVAVAAVPLKVTVLLPCVAPKFVPVIVTGVPTVPEVGLRVLIVGAEAVTVKLTPLLARPPTVTTTLPVVAPAGTVTAMLVLPQVVAVAAVPLKVTVLLPCVAPKFVPVIVTGVPTVPEVGLRVLIVGAEAVTVKLTPLLARPPTVTPPLPVVAPAGTVTAMLVLPQVVAVAAVPLKVTVLLPCVAPKFVPVIVTGVPTVPEVGLRVLIVGAEAVTVKLTPLLARPPTVTTTLPVVAPAGTVTAMLVLPQVVAVAAVPLKVTVLLPCVAPKFVPVIVTGVPTVPEVGLRVLIVGAEAVTVKLTPLLARPPTVTPPLPVVAPAGTVTAMLVLPQVVAVAAVPLKVTVLLPCVAPKFVPVIVTGVPTVPEVGLRVLIVGAEAVTVKLTPLLARPPTVTTTLPVVAPAGTVTAMLVLPQVVAVAAVPLKVTVLLPCVAPKFVPVIVTGVPTVPEVGLRVLIVGAEAVTVKLTPLLARPPTVTTTLPVVAPAGTVTAMLVLPQVVAVAAVPLKVTVLLPCVAPKFVPVI